MFSRLFSTLAHLRTWQSSVESRSVASEGGIREFEKKRTRVKHSGLPCPRIVTVTSVFLQWRFESLYTSKSAVILRIIPPGCKVK